MSLQMKVFKGLAEDVEKDFEAWKKDSQSGKHTTIRDTHMFFNEVGNTLTMTIFYEPSVMSFDAIDVFQDILTRLNKLYAKVVELEKNTIGFIPLDHARSVSTAWRDNIITYKEYRKALNYKIDTNDSRNDLYYNEFKEIYGPSANILTDSIDTTTREERPKTETGEK